MEDADEFETELQTPYSELKQETILPRPLASAVSLFTATSSVSLRLGGLVGKALISGARIGTLTGFELGRTTLEGILSRAGHDVAETSTSSVGRTAAEGMLDRALLALHDTITKTSFLISTGFQLGSTSVSASLGFAQYLLSALDATLGDTETSRAIATILVLIRREFRNPETGVNGERVGLGDVIVGIIAFALLQKWGHERTVADLKMKGCEETIWSLVVVNENMLDTEQPLSLYEADDPPINHRRVSLASPIDQEQMVDASMVEDNVSTISTTTRPFSSGGDNMRPELAFRQHLTDQLDSGTVVRVVAQSLTTNTVSVEIEGDSTAQIDPPFGYSLVAAHQDDSPDKKSQKLVFQNKRRRVRRGSFEISGTAELMDIDQSNDDSIPRPTSPPLNAESLAALEASTQLPFATRDRDLEPIKANEKRTRSPVASRESRIPVKAASPQHSKITANDHTNPQSKPSFIRRNLSRGTSYKNLVEFWSNGQQRNRRNEPSNGNVRAELDSSNPNSTQSPSPLQVRPPVLQSRHSLPAPNHLQVHGRTQSSVDIAERPPSRRVHRRGSSSALSLASVVSEDSLVLRNVAGDFESISINLNRDGRLPGQYPHDSFAHNTTRFVRFSVASYGSKFLRFIGALQSTPENVPEFSNQVEHHAFASYSRLPASTVLVSSFVDPEGGTNASGETETGMPLTHYISLDHESKAVVLTCRGTMGFEDVLTDATCDYDDFIWGGKAYQVHKGMYASARRLLSLHGNRLTATIKAALEEFKDYGLVLCGHSLGGSVAAILGVMLSHPNHQEGLPFITGSYSATPSLNNLGPPKHAANRKALTLPTGRPIHVYTYGPAASISPALQRATRGLITTIVNNQDSIPYLSLGMLRDFQAIALAFKTDTKDSKGEVRRRVWEGLKDGIRDRSGLSAFGGITANEWLPDEKDEDHWPWAALQSLRAGLVAPKLVPPGEVFIIEARPVLQRYAFVTKDAEKSGEHNNRTTKPATHVKLTHIKDVALGFGELKFGSGMYADHLPSRYEKALEALERGVI